MKALLILLLICPWENARGISIREISVTGDGADEDKPLEEGEDLELKCRADDSTWKSCFWVHEIEDQRDEYGNKPKVVCTIGSQHGSDNCDTESNPPMASRMRLTQSGDTCTIRISNTEAVDGGVWKCNIFDDPSEAGTYDELSVYVSNQSTIYITEPDLWENPNDVITFDLNNPNDEIEATCTAYGGNPAPEFHWYVEDERNEIPSKELNTRRVESKDDKGEYVQEQMSWTPTREELCQYSKVQNYCGDETFSFNLLCKVEQKIGSQVYYQDENDQQMAEVLVEVRSGSSTIFASFTIIALGLLSSTLPF